MSRTAKIYCADNLVLVSAAATIASFRSAADQLTDRPAAGLPDETGRSIPALVQDGPERVTRGHSTLP